MRSRHGKAHQNSRNIMVAARHGYVTELFTVIRKFALLCQLCCYVVLNDDNAMLCWWGCCYSIWTSYAVAQTTVKSGCKQPSVVLVLVLLLMMLLLLMVILLFQCCFFDIDSFSCCSISKQSSLLTFWCYKVFLDPLNSLCSLYYWVNSEHIAG